MYWTALSTDIKKSSVNWSGLPSWMQNAVQYHNIIIETVVKRYKKVYNPHGVECKLLPNAPEGDAYTYYFNHTNMDELREFVIFLGTDIQKIFDEVRKFDNFDSDEQYPEKLRRKIMLKPSDLVGELKKKERRRKKKKKKRRRRRRRKKKRKKKKKKRLKHTNGFKGKNILVAFSYG